MKKLDKLILSSFIGPFMLTFLVVIFILLSRQMLYYFDDIIGKDLGLAVVAHFIFYFILLTVPIALPLAILLSCLITFGNLAEHFELTAIKSAGISLLRVIRPIFFLTLFLTYIAFLANNYLAPYAALEAYTLLYDIKQKKPTLDIREGIFYSGLPDVSIQVKKKFSDDPAALKNILLYDHRNIDGQDIFIADSGRMYTIFNDRYLKFELYRGYNYKDNPKYTPGASETRVTTLSRTEFIKMEIVFNLSSFDLPRTSKELFAGNKLMRNISQIEHDIDSLTKIIDTEETSPGLHLFQYFRINEIDRPRPWNSDSAKVMQQVAVLRTEPLLPKLLEATTNRVRQAKQLTVANHEQVNKLYTEVLAFKVQWHKILANSFACLAMFFIGAPMGAIIKRGGLGVPFLVSIVFFILYTLLGMLGEDIAMQCMINESLAVWMANGLLSGIALLLFQIAWRDGSLF